TAFLKESMGEPEMARAKQALKRNRRSKTVPVLGAAGLSLSLASGASASTGGPAADVMPQNTSPNHELFLGEEEIPTSTCRPSTSSTHENDAATLKAGVKEAYWRRCRCGCARACRRVESLWWMRGLLRVLGTLPLVLDATAMRRSPR